MKWNGMPWHVEIVIFFSIVFFSQKMCAIAFHPVDARTQRHLNNFNDFIQFNIIHIIAMIIVDLGKLFWWGSQ